MDTIINNVWVFLIIISLICYAIHDIIFRIINIKGYNPSERIKHIVGVLLFLVFFGIAYFTEESTTIKNGAKYYVNLFETIDAQKNYRVPGLIYNHEEDGISLYEVYWSNGGSTTFENSYYIDLIVGEKVEMKDDEDRTWYVELTKEKVE